jgi:hypothetical protein
MPRSPSGARSPTPSIWLQDSFIGFFDGLEYGLRQGVTALAMTLTTPHPLLVIAVFAAIAWAAAAPPGAGPDRHRLRAFRAQPGLLGPDHADADAGARLVLRLHGRSACHSASSRRITRASTAG